MLAGLIVGIWLIPGPRTIGNVTFSVHTLVYSMAAMVLGFQSVVFAVFTKTFAISVGLHPQGSRLDRWQHVFSLEKGLLVGGVLTLIGLGGSIHALSDWGSQLYGPLDPVETLRLIVPSILFLIMGVQTILSSFVISVLAIGRK